MILEIAIWEIIVIFVLIILYYFIKAGLNLAVYKKTTQELDRVINELHTKECNKTKSKKK